MICFHDIWRHVKFHQWRISVVESDDTPYVEKYSVNRCFNIVLKTWLRIQHNVKNRICTDTSSWKIFYKIIFNLQLFNFRQIKHLLLISNFFPRNIPLFVNFNSTNANKFNRSIHHSRSLNICPQIYNTPLWTSKRLYFGKIRTYWLFPGLYNKYKIYNTYLIISSSADIFRELSV